MIACLLVVSGLLIGYGFRSLLSLLCGLLGLMLGFCFAVCWVDSVLGFRCCVCWIACVVCVAFFSLTHVFVLLLYFIGLGWGGLSGFLGCLCGILGEFRGLGFW